MSITLTDFKTWYENNQGQTPKHKATLDPITDYPIADNCLALILGATGSGKSYVLKDIFDRVPYDIIFFISPTSAFDQTQTSRPMSCKYIIHYDNPETGVEKVYEYLMRRLLIRGAIDDYNNLAVRKQQGGIVSDFDLNKKYEVIEELTNGQSLEFYNESFRVAVVLDDCGYQSNQMKKKESELTKLVMIRRHLGVSIFACLQSYVQIEKDIRRQCSDILMTKKTPNEDLKALYQQLSNLPHKDIISQPRFFTALVEGLTKDHEFGTVQFLYGGLYHDFKPVSRDDIVNIIKEYEALRKEMRTKITR